MTFTPLTTKIQCMARQRGASLPAVLLIGIIIIFLATVAFKMVPHYLDYNVIQKSVEGFENAAPNSAKSPAAFYAYMQKTMELNSIRDIKAEDIMNVERSGNQFVVHIDYERREPMIKNLSLIAHFEKELSVRIP